MAAPASPRLSHTQIQLLTVRALFEKRLSSSCFSSQEALFGAAALTFSRAASNSKLVPGPASCTLTLGLISCLCPPVFWFPLISVFAISLPGRFHAALWMFPHLLFHPPSSSPSALSRFPNLSSYLFFIYLSLLFFSFLRLPLRVTQPVFLSFPLSPYPSFLPSWFLLNNGEKLLLIYNWFHSL